MNPSDNFDDTDYLSFLTPSQLTELANNKLKMNQNPVLNNLALNSLASNNLNYGLNNQFNNLNSLTGLPSLNQNYNMLANNFNLPNSLTQSNLLNANKTNQLKELQQQLLFQQLQQQQLQQQQFQQQQAALLNQLNLTNLVNNNLKFQGLSSSLNPPKNINSSNNLFDSLNSINSLSSGSNLNQLGSINSLNNLQMTQSLNLPQNTLPNSLPTSNVNTVPLSNTSFTLTSALYSFFSNIPTNLPYSPSFLYITKPELINLLLELNYPTNSWHSTESSSYVLKIRNDLKIYLNNFFVDNLKIGLKSNKKTLLLLQNFVNLLEETFFHLSASIDTYKNRNNLFSVLTDCIIFILKLIHFLRLGKISIYFFKQNLTLSNNFLTSLDSASQIFIKNNHDLLSRIFILRILKNLKFFILKNHIKKHPFNIAKSDFNLFLLTNLVYYFKNSTNQIDYLKLYGGPPVLISDQSTYLYSIEDMIEWWIMYIINRFENIINGCFYSGDDLYNIQLSLWCKEIFLSLYNINEALKFNEKIDEDSKDIDKKNKLTFYFTNKDFFNKKIKSLPYFCDEDNLIFERIHEDKFDFLDEHIENLLDENTKDLLGESINNFIADNEESKFSQNIVALPNLPEISTIFNISNDLQQYSDASVSNYLPKNHFSKLEPQSFINHSSSFVDIIVTLKSLLQDPKYSHYISYLPNNLVVYISDLNHLLTILYGNNLTKGVGLINSNLIHFISVLKANSVQFISDLNTLKAADDIHFQQNNYVYIYHNLLINNNINNNSASTSLVNNLSQLKAQQQNSNLSQQLQLALSGVPLNNNLSQLNLLQNLNNQNLFKNNLNLLSQSNNLSSLINTESLTDSIDKSIYDLTKYDTNYNDSNNNYDLYNNYDLLPSAIMGQNSTQSTSSSLSSNTLTSTNSSINQWNSSTHNKSLNLSPPSLGLNSSMTPSMLLNRSSISSGPLPTPNMPPSSISNQPASKRAYRKSQDEEICDLIDYRLLPVGSKKTNNSYLPSHKRIKLDIATENPSDEINFKFIQLNGKLMPENIMLTKKNKSSIITNANVGTFQPTANNHRRIFSYLNHGIYVPNQAPSDIISTPEAIKIEKPPAPYTGSRVGPEYQIEPPEMLTSLPSLEEKLKQRENLVWDPKRDLTGDKIGSIIFNNSEPKAEFKRTNKDLKKLLNYCQKYGSNTSLTIGSLQFVHFKDEIKNNNANNGTNNISNESSENIPKSEKVYRSYYKLCVIKGIYSTLTAEPEILQLISSKKKSKKNSDLETFLVSVYDGENTYYVYSDQVVGLQFMEEDVVLDKISSFNYNIDKAARAIFDYNNAERSYSTGNNSVNTLMEISSENNSSISQQFNFSSLNKFSNRSTWQFSHVEYLIGNFRKYNDNIYRIYKNIYEDPSKFNSKKSSRSLTAAAAVAAAASNSSFSPLSNSTFQESTCLLLSNFPHKNYSPPNNFHCRTWPDLLEFGLFLYPYIKSNKSKFLLNLYKKSHFFKNSPRTSFSTPIINFYYDPLVKIFYNLFNLMHSFLEREKSKNVKTDPPIRTNYVVALIPLPLISADDEFNITDKLSDLISSPLSPDIVRNSLQTFSNKIRTYNELEQSESNKKDFYNSLDYAVKEVITKEDSIKIIEIIKNILASSKNENCSTNYLPIYFNHFQEISDIIQGKSKISASNYNTDSDNSLHSLSDSESNLPSSNVAETIKLENDTQPISVKSENENEESIPEKKISRASRNKNEKVSVKESSDITNPIGYNESSLDLNLNQTSINVDDVSFKRKQPDDSITEKTKKVKTENTVTTSNLIANPISISNHLHEEMINSNIENINESFKNGLKLSDIPKDYKPMTDKKSIKLYNKSFEKYSSLSTDFKSFTSNQNDLFIILKKLLKETSLSNSLVNIKHPLLKKRKLSNNCSNLDVVPSICYFYGKLQLKDQVEKNKKDNDKKKNEENITLCYCNKNFQKNSFYIKCHIGLKNQCNGWVHTDCCSLDGIINFDEFNEEILNISNSKSKKDLNSITDSADIDKLLIKNYSRLLTLRKYICNKCLNNIEK